MNIAADAVVTIHYTVQNPQGEELDSSVGSDPMVYLHGHGQIVPGLERELLGKAPGERVKTVVEPGDAYGDYEECLDLKVPNDAFPPEVRTQLRPGAVFVADHPLQPDREVMYHVVAIEGDDVLVSGNHPLAGETLHFDVEVLDVREATIEELEHGHAHDGHGHHGDDEE